MTSREDDAAQGGIAGNATVQGRWPRTGATGFAYLARDKVQIELTIKPTAGAPRLSLLSREKMGHLNTAILRHLSLLSALPGQQGNMSSALFARALPIIAEIINKTPQA